MRTLKDHTILYDAECPMCKLYTNSFGKMGLLDKQGIRPYQQETAKSCPTVDFQRAVNEIALVNNNTGEVKYGVQSLFAILGHAFPAFNPLFTFKPFSWLMSKLYAFISYNRRVIIPVDMEEEEFTWQPAFRLNYRIAYLLFTCLVTAAILSQYALRLIPVFPSGIAYREYLIIFGQLLLLGTIAAFLYPRRVWNYLGNLATISFTGALLLIPALLLSNWISLGPQTYGAYFLVVAILMLLEHIRRSQLLHLNWVLTISWILYRIVVLYAIFRQFV